MSQVLVDKSRSLMLATSRALVKTRVVSYHEIPILKSGPLRQSLSRLRTRVETSRTLLHESCSNKALKEQTTT